tara:strand:- start:1087 stop:2862 length:1776 start_codon:yes stop_codon:yes gene_type:complete
MVNKTPLADLPSIDEFIVEPEELPSVVEFLPEEVVEEEIQTIEDADGNAFLEVEDVIKAPEWGELVRMVNDVRKDIPEIPEVKDYAPELEEISANIQQIKNEIPVVPEVRYYEEELQALRESINKVEDSIPSLPNWISKVTEVPDFAWVGKGFNVIDEDFRGVKDTISTLASRVTIELERIQEEGDTKQFETKTDFKTIHERVDIVRKDIFKELREQSTVIWNLQKKLKNNQKEFEITFNEKVGNRFDTFSEVTKKTVDNLQESFVESTDNLAKHMDGEVKSLQERIKTLPKPKYYEEDLKNIRKELKNLTELKALVYDIQLKQKDLSMIQEGILNEPPDTAENIGSGQDPLTPMDKKFATLKDLAEHYRIFINRIQTQLATMGGGGAGSIKDLDDVDFDQTTGNNQLLIFDQANTKWVGIDSTALAPATETLDQTLIQGNTSAMGMDVGVVTSSGGMSIKGVATISDTTNSTSGTTGALIVSGGVGIAKSLHVTGNISCAGTTYYEDVTNIDSVGIVTARTRLLVGTGVTYSPTELVVDGDGRVTGVLTVGTGSITLDPSTDTITAAVIEQTDGVKLSDKASIGMVLALS